MLEDDGYWDRFDDQPWCSMCDAFGHGNFGCPLENRGEDEDERRWRR